MSCSEFGVMKTTIVLITAFPREILNANRFGDQVLLPIRRALKWNVEAQS
jgi:hypothetical protein